MADSFLLKKKKSFNVPLDLVDFTILGILQSLQAQLSQLPFFIHHLNWAKE